MNCEKKSSLQHAFTSDWCDGDLRSTDWWRIGRPSTSLNLVVTTTTCETRTRPTLHAARELGKEAHNNTKVKTAIIYALLLVQQDQYSDCSEGYCFNDMSFEDHSRLPFLRLIWHLAMCYKKAKTKELHYGTALCWYIRASSNFLSGTRYEV